MATFAAPAVERRDRFFYVGMAGLVALVVFVGFAPTFYLKGFYANRPLPLLVAIHGAAFTAWIILLLAQSSLVFAGRIDLHRRMGVAGGFLAGAMIVLGTSTAIASAQRRMGGSTDLHELQFLTIPFGDMLVFGILVTTGLYFRKKAQIHKRLMLLSTIAILDPAVARLRVGIVRRYHEPAFFAITDLILMTCILYDTLTHRRLHRAYLLGWTPNHGNAARAILPWPHGCLGRCSTLDRSVRALSQCRHREALDDSQPAFPTCDLYL